MKLSVFKREKKGKGALTDIRARNGIPAVLYGKKIENQTVFVKGEEFSAVMRKIPTNHLSNTRFSLDYEGKTYYALVKGIEYHKITYNPLHLDFMIVEQDDLVNVNIPILCTGTVDCVGLKLGGVLRQVIRSYKVRCLVKDIPTSCVVDVQAMNVGDAKRLSDIALPKDVHPLLNVSEVAISIAKR
ncbi:MAG: 50S ribosomal protein L25 [Chlamydiota bacterium]